MKKFLPFLLIGLLIPGCSWLAVRQRIKKCKFKIKSYRPTKFSLKQPRFCTLTVVLAIKNPNDGEALLEPFEWRLLIQDILVARGKHIKQLTIPTHKKREITLNIRVDLWKLSKSVMLSIIRARAEYKMEATVYLSTPFGTMEYEVLIKKGSWSAQGKKKGEKKMRKKREKEK